MPLSKIKAEFKDKKIAFGKGRSDKPISEREDIDDLAIIALESQDRSLLRLFEKLPELSDLKRIKTDDAIKVADIKRKIIESRKQDKEKDTPSAPPPFANKNFGKKPTT